MGFGILIFGYFAMFAFSLTQTYFFADIIGACITIYAFSKLAAYNRLFNKAMAAACAFLLLCALTAVSLMFTIYPTDGTAALLVNLLKSVAAAVMHVYTFLGARGIALGAGADKLADKAEHRLIATLIYYVISVLVTLICTLGNLESRYIGMALLLYWIVCLIMNLVFFYRCFAVLCPADEDESSPKQSRFKLINQIDAKMDDFQENNRRFTKTSQNEAKKKAAEKKAAHSHKKKKR